MNDWSARIKQLEEAGWSLTQIASDVGLSVSSISDLKNGRSDQPRGMAAVKLHALHERVCPVDQKAA
jgi:transcriptional regulator with XRE-family HTH domain